MGKGERLRRLQNVQRMQKMLLWRDLGLANALRERLSTERDVRMLLLTHAATQSHSASRFESLSTAPVDEAISKAELAAASLNGRVKRIERQQKIVGGRVLALAREAAWIELDATVRDEVLRRIGPTQALEKL